MTNKNIKELETKVLSAKILFSAQQAWFGSLIGKLKLKVSSNNQKFPTCATDGRTIYFGEAFISTLTIKELVFVFGHEVLHCLLNHHLRGTQGKDLRLWNIACDYVVNDLLIKGKIGIMPKGALYNDKYSGKTVEGIYEQLVSLPPKQRGTLNTLDDHSAMNEKAHLESDEIEIEEESLGGMSEETGEEWSECLEDIEKEIRKYAQDSEAGLESSLAKLLSAECPEFSSYYSSLSWREELKDYIKEKFSTDFTYLRPNKKTQSMGFTFPTPRTEEKLNIAIALDTSGSMEDRWITNFLGEITEILSSYEFGSIHLWCFDTKVHNYQIFQSSEISELNSYHPLGGGGTKFEVNWKHLENEALTPDLLLMLTDGHPGDSWGDEYVIDAVFAIAGDPSKEIKAPFGKTIYID